MSNISLLDQSTINKIAAGEVIERPSAVVKELIENAIDAGANAITAEIKEGGISFIRITDNGRGILKEEVPIAFLRHSTSKIRSAEDLMSVSSLGFRGEALSSIASVSQVELLTKTEQDLTGTRYTIEGGKEKVLEEIGCPNGTTFIVRNLFYNTPARRKFLKSSGTEAGYISDLVERLAVSHPNISFKFINNNQIKLHTSGNNNLKDIIYGIYGREISANTVELKERSNHVLIQGLVGKPVISRGNRNYQNYYINGRYVKSSMINKAIDEAYKPYLMNHRYPFTAIHFVIDSEFLDVNVHPTKMEIRFKNGEEIFNLTFQTIRNALRGKEMIPSVSLVEEKEEAKKYREIPEPFEVRRKKELEKTLYPKYSPGTSKMSESAWNEKVNVNQLRPERNSMTFSKTFVDQDKIAIPNDSGKSEFTYGETKEIVNQTEIGKLDYAVKHGQLIKEEGHYEAAQSFPIVKNAEQVSLFEDKLLSEKAKKHHRIIGQLFSTYWIIEYNDKMFIIDQHAAHEKVLFEKTMSSVKKKEFLSQMLQPPIILSLSMTEEQSLTRHMESLQSLGFEIEHFGGREYSVRAVPSDLFGVAQRDLLIELIDSLEEDSHKNAPELILEKVASMSCKAAVKGNNKLSYDEAVSLIDQLLELENPYHCPHGRPTIIAMSKYEIEKKFKRIL